MSKEITAFFKGRVGVCESVYQYDYGRVMVIDGIDGLTSAFDCYFSTTGEEEAIPAIGADNRVAIPNDALSRSGDVKLHIPIHEGENDSEVEYIVTFHVIGRAKPIDDGSDEDQTAIAQAIALLRNPVANMEQIVNEALSFTGATLEDMQAQIDAEVGTRTTNDTVLSGRVDNLVSAVKTNAATKLIEDGTGLFAGSHTLSDSVANYDYLELFFRGTNGRMAYSEKIPVSESSFETSLPYALYSTSDPSDPTVILQRAKISFSGTTMTIEASSRWMWNGDSTSDAIVDDQDAWSVMLSRVDGIKVGINMPAELTDIRVGADGVTDTTAGASVRRQFTDLKSDLDDINGSWINTKGIDYNNLTISENKKISGYDTSTYEPILVSANGSVVADFSKEAISQYQQIKFPRCSISNQWVIIYGASIANNYTKANTSVGTIVDFSNADYGIINCKKLADNASFTRVAIAFDGRVDITVDSQFETFFDLMDSVKKNESAYLNIRDLYYSDNIDITAQSTSTYVPFEIVSGESFNIKNNTAGNVSLYAIDSSNERTLISSSISSGGSVTFTADKDYIQLLYWAQQLGTITVERLNTIINEMQNEIDALESGGIIASVNMFESIGAIGDSYTAGSTRNSAGTWKDYRNLSWIATMGKRSGTEWKNYGHGGATTKSFLETTEFANALTDTACDLYFFALGQNDGNQALTIGTVTDIHDSDYTQNPDTFYGNYGRIIQQIKDHAPNAKLVMITNWVQGATWTAYDVAIRAIANHYSIPVIEPFDDSFFRSALYQDYKEYGHPTVMGYSSMGIAMERLFSKCVESNPLYFKFSTIG